VVRESGGDEDGAPSATRWAAEADGGVEGGAVGLGAGETEGEFGVLAVVGGGGASGVARWDGCAVGVGGTGVACCIAAGCAADGVAARAAGGVNWRDAVEVGGVAERESVELDAADAPGDPSGGPTSSAPTAPGLPAAAWAAEAACHAAGAFVLLAALALTWRAAAEVIDSVVADGDPTGRRAMACERWDATGGRGASSPGALRPRAATARMTEGVCAAMGNARRRQRMNGRTGSPNTWPAASP